jgi:hypothetical protein
MPSKAIDFDRRLFSGNFFHVMRYLKRDDVRYIFAYGGSSSGKTYGIVQAMLISTLRDAKNTLVFRKVLASIRKTIFNDFKIMLANSDLMCWEHHGMCSDFTYRNNAGERVMVMKFTRSVPSGGLIETFEHDVDSPDKIIGILKKEVLPKLWF